jgi:hypothetical protein
VGHRIRTLSFASAASGDQTIDLPLAGFAPGDYTVEVAAASGTHEATERATFRVTY